MRNFKNFDTCYFIWKLLYKNNIKFISQRDKNISFEIQIFNNEMNVNKDFLLIIIANLLLGDMTDKKKCFLIVKSDYNEYLDFLKNSEVIYQEFLQGNILYNNPSLDNLNIYVVSDLINYIYAMTESSVLYDENIKELVQLAKNSIFLENIELVDYTEESPICFINMLYKHLLITYIDFKKFKAYLNEEKELEEFSQRIISNDYENKSIEYLNQHYMKLKSKLEKTRRKYEKKLENKGFFDSEYIK